VSTRTSRSSSTAVAFVAAVHNYSRRNYSPLKGVVHARGRGAAWRISEAVRRVFDQSPSGSGNMARSVVLKRWILQAHPLSRMGIAAGVEEGLLEGSHDGVRAVDDPTGGCSCERDEGLGGVWARAANVYARTCAHVHRARARARAHPRMGGSPKQRRMVHTRGRSGLILAADSGIPCNCQK